MPADFVEVNFGYVRRTINCLNWKGALWKSCTSVQSLCVYDTKDNINLFPSYHSLQVDLLFYFILFCYLRYWFMILGTASFLLHFMFDNFFERVWTISLMCNVAVHSYDEGGRTTSFDENVFECPSGIRRSWSR